MTRATHTPIPLLSPLPPRTEGADEGSLDYALNRAVDAFYNDRWVWGGGGDGAAPAQQCRIVQPRDEAWLGGFATGVCAVSPHAAAHLPTRLVQTRARARAGPGSAGCRRA